MRSERLRLMEAYLKENEMCSLRDLCDIFEVAMITIRRDIEELFRAGTIEKTYGGVRYVKGNIPATLPYLQRNIRNVSQKDFIGKLAADIVKPGDSIFVDSGTTTLNIVKYITNEPINIATNSFTVVDACRGRENINVIVLGGQFNRITNSFADDFSARAFSQYNISKAFLAATGASVEYGFTNSAIAESSIKKEAISKCRERYVMIDKDKWDVVSLKTFANISDVTGVVTDSKPPAKYVDLFRENGTRLIYTDNSPNVPIKNL